VHSIALFCTLHAGVFAQEHLHPPPYLCPAWHPDEGQPVV
jgi:hypothetical protein